MPEIKQLQKKLEEIQATLEEIRQAAGTSSITQGEVTIQTTADGGGVPQKLTVNLETHLAAIESVIQQGVIQLAEGNATNQQELTINGIVQTLQSLTKQENSTTYLQVLTAKSDTYAMVSYTNGTAGNQVSLDSAAMQKLHDQIDALCGVIQSPPPAGSDTSNINYYTPSYVTLYGTQEDWSNAMAEAEITTEVRKEKRKLKEMGSLDKKLLALSADSESAEYLMGFQKGSTTAAPAPTRAAAKSSTPPRPATPTSSTSSSGKGEFYPLASGLKKLQYFSVAVKYHLDQSTTGSVGGLWLRSKPKTATASSEVNEKVLFAAANRGNDQVGLIMEVTRQFKKMLKNKNKSLISELESILSGNAKSNPPSDELKSVIKAALAQYHALEVMYAEAVAAAKQAGTSPPPPSFFMRKAPADSEVWARVMIILAKSNGREVNLDGMAGNIKQNLQNFNPSNTDLSHFASFINDRANGFETKMLVCNAQALSNQLHHTLLTGATTPVAAPVTSPTPRKQGVLSAGAGGGTATPAQMAAEALIAAALLEEGADRTNYLKECAIAIQQAVAKTAITNNNPQPNNDLVALLNNIATQAIDYWNNPVTDENEAPLTTADRVINQLLKIRGGDGGYVAVGAAALPPLDSSEDLQVIAEKLQAIRGAVESAQPEEDSHHARLAGILKILQEKANKRKETAWQQEQLQLQPQTPQPNPVDRAAQEAVQACIALITVCGKTYTGDGEGVQNAAEQRAQTKQAAAAAMQALLLAQIKHKKTEDGDEAVQQWEANNAADQEELRNALEKIAKLCVAGVNTKINDRNEAYYELIKSLSNSVTPQGDNDLIYNIWETLNAMLEISDDEGNDNNNKEFRKSLIEARNYLYAFKEAQDCIHYFLGNLDGNEKNNLANEMAQCMINALKETLQSSEQNTGREWTVLNDNASEALQNALKAILDKMPAALEEGQKTSLIDELQKKMIENNNHLNLNDHQKARILLKISQMLDPIIDAIGRAKQNPINNITQLQNSLAQIKHTALTMHITAYKKACIDAAINLIESAAINIGTSEEWMKNEFRYAAYNIITAIFNELKLNHAEGVNWCLAQNEPSKTANLLSDKLMACLKANQESPHQENLLELIQNAIITFNGQISDQEKEARNQAIITVLAEVQSGVINRNDLIAAPPHQDNNAQAARNREAKGNLEAIFGVLAEINNRAENQNQPHAQPHQ